MTVIPVILITIIAYITVTNRYAALTKENTKKYSSDYSYFFSSHLESQIIDISALTENPDIKSCLVDMASDKDRLILSSSDNYKHIVTTLNTLSANFDQNVEYYIYNTDGYLIMSSDEDASADWTEIMKTEIHTYSDTTLISHSRFTENTMDILEPVIADNNVIGLIRANITSDYFNNSLTDIHDHFLIDESGQFMLGYEPSVRDKAFCKYIRAIADNADGGENTIDASLSSEISGVYTDRLHYIYGYTLIPEYNWIYVVRQDASTYFSIVSTLPWVFIVVLITVTILSILLSETLADKYTDPIMDICQKMELATNGQLSVRCDTGRTDEFGTLASSFNQMLDIISTNYNDISSARKELEKKQKELEANYRHIEDLAYKDTLTGLNNRTAFYLRGTQILSHNEGGIKEHAVIFIDLDGFKAINDTLGHDYGDLLLQSVARQFTMLISEDDILARNGGDEFVIFRNHIGANNELKDFLQALVSIGQHPFQIEDETVHVTISAGVALFPRNGLSLSELMKNADIAMYTSKSSGKNSYTFFSSKMEDEINRRNDLIEILRNAIAENYVYLVFPPQANIATGEIVGFEALMRLKTPLMGFISPEEFIPVAEECGLIDELGEWALIEACSFNKRLIDAGFKPLRVSVNVSTVQLHDNTHLVNIIESLPEKTSMPLEYLEIELTESVLMKNFDHNLALINQIKKLDVSISLDDFGTGYSSFSYLTRIPFNTLKIDKSFIDGICINPTDMYIAGTIINLAHHLGITVIAEGVETIEQLRILQEQTCDVLQGYLFSKPITEQDFVELLKVNS